MRDRLRTEDVDGVCIVRLDAGRLNVLDLSAIRALQDGLRSG